MPANHLEGLPENAKPIGYAWLASEMGLKCPLARRSAVSDKTVRQGSRDEWGWTVHDSRSAVGDSTMANLDFAIRKEGVDLTVLKKAFEAIEPKDVEKYVSAVPKGATQRRTWFLYEWLTGREVPLRDMRPTNYVDALDPAAYHVGKATESVRHKVRDNLPGNRAFCPVIRRGPSVVTGNLRETLSATLADAGPDVARRAAGHLVLADSRSSFLIEGEKPPQDRLRRWAATLGTAGREPLSLAGLEALQAQVVGDERFVQKGIRTSGVYLGHRDRWNDPVPEFVGARPEDLRDLVEGMVAFDRAMSAGDTLDPIAHAAALSFGFVYVHPFEDGNGRVHRYLMHHVLASRNFVPRGVVLPLSNVMERDREGYGEVLRGHSGPLMDHIPWRGTGDGNVEVTEDTSDLYRYPDVTAETAYLAGCVAATIGEDLPEEIRWIRGYDAAKGGIAEVVEMPDRKVEDFVTFMRQNPNGWRLPAKRRKREFSLLSDTEVAEMEAVVREAFGVDTPVDVPTGPPV